MEKIDKFFRILKETKEPAFDVETNGLDWKKCHVVGYSVSDGKESVYVPVRHDSGGNISNVELFEQELASAIAEHTGKIVGHNIKFDAHFCQNHGILLNRVADTMIREALIDENRKSYSLENVCKNYDIQPKLGYQLYAHISNITGCAPNRGAMGQYYKLRGDDRIAVEYAEGDTLTTKQLYDVQRKLIYAQSLDVVDQLEADLCSVLQKIERRGISINIEELSKLKESINERYEKGYGAFIQEDEHGFPSFVNLHSSRDLREYFEHCDIFDWPTTAPTERFPNGQASFTQDYLMQSEEGLKILNLRKLSHFRNNFLEKIDDHIFKDKVYTTFHQAINETHGTRFGRLSCSNPNMQQVPKRDEELGKLYRKIFVPPEDFIFVEYDYSQAEPRLYAHYSGEPRLVEGYSADPPIDMHVIAAKYMEVPRSVAKNLNMGMMYSMGIEKLGRKLGVDYDKAASIMRQWRETFPRVSNYDNNNPGFTQRASSTAENRGYVRTILGRRARFNDRRWCYRAANRIVQGGSADIMKWKLVEIDRFIENESCAEKCQMLLTIHDSILFAIHKDHAQLILKIKQIMEKVNGPPFNLTVPFLADFKMGSNWSEATYV
jgi:DNA polymerase I